MQGGKFFSGLIGVQLVFIHVIVLFVLFTTTLIAVAAAVALNLRPSLPLFGRLCPRLSSPTRAGTGTDLQVALVSQLQLSSSEETVRTAVLRSVSMVTSSSAS